jgi:urease accessory protein
MHRCLHYNVLSTMLRCPPCAAPPPSTMDQGASTWSARLSLRYRLSAAGRTLALDHHEGPLRVLKPLHPEGAHVCHHALVHPPGGIVGGDALSVDVELSRGAHAVLTTPGATRWYRSAVRAASQTVRLHVETGARLEWLPLEALAYSGCLASNSVELVLSHGGETMGWDVIALGLPESNQPFDRGRFEQRVAMPGAWLEAGVIDAFDKRLLQSPLGFGGREVVASAWFAAGTALDYSRAHALLEAGRAVDVPDVPGLLTGLTSPDQRVVLARALGHRVEPVMQWLIGVRAAWRRVAWGLDAFTPRLWQT